MQIIDDLIKRRIDSNSDAVWDLSSKEIWDGARTTTIQHRIEQDITHIAEVDWETEKKIQDVAQECVGAYTDGGYDRMMYIIEMHNNLPEINLYIKTLEAQVNELAEDKERLEGYLAEYELNNGGQ